MKIWLTSILGASPTVHVMWGLAKVQENHVAYVIRESVANLKVRAKAHVKKHLCTNFLTFRYPNLILEFARHIILLHATSHFQAKAER